METLTDVIIENEGLIYSIINKYQYHFEIEDLYQVAALALGDAYTKYDPRYGTKFTSYAYPFVLGAVLKYINNERTIRLSRTNKSKYLKILHGMEELTQVLMKIPTTYELAVFLEMDELEVSEILNSNAQIDSLDRIVNEDNKNLEMYDHIGYDDKNIENLPLSSALESLDPLERALIEARYFYDLSQKETGKKLGMYQVEVSRKEGKILKKLHDHMAA